MSFAQSRLANPVSPFIGATGCDDWRVVGIGEVILGPDFAASQSCCHVLVSRAYTRTPWFEHFPSQRVSTSMWHLASALALDSWGRPPPVPPPPPNNKAPPTHTATKHRARQHHRLPRTHTTQQSIPAQHISCRRLEQDPNCGADKWESSDCARSGDYFDHLDEAPVHADFDRSLRGARLIRRERERSRPVIRNYSW